MRTTNRWISSWRRGRPGPRRWLPSYFLAISRRCQASSVAGSFNVECNPGTVGTFLSKAEKDPDAARDHSEKLKTRDYYIGETFCPLAHLPQAPAFGSFWFTASSNGLPERASLNLNRQPCRSLFL